LATFFLATNVQAQDLQILVNKKGKIGYADKNGNEVVKCQYDSGQPFSGGVAIVTKSGKSGIIDLQGNVLLPIKYSQIMPWNDDLYIIKAGKKMGLADHAGNIVLPTKYSHISKPNCYGKALIALGGKATTSDKKTYMANAKYGIINTKGEVLITPLYKGLYEFSYDCKGKYPYYEGKRLEYSYHYTVDTLVTDCSYLGFSTNGFNIYNAGIMDTTGKELIKPKLYYFVMQPQCGMARYFIVKKKETICGYHSVENGNNFQVAKFEKAFADMDYWSHGDFTGEIAPVNGESWTFVDKTGKVLRSGYTSLKYGQSIGLWAAKNSSELWDVFDENSNSIPNLTGYADIYFPKDKKDQEIFSVKKEEEFGCIDRSGNVCVPFEFEQMLGNTYDMVAVKKNGKWGMKSPDNKNLVPAEYMNILLPSEPETKHLWVQKSDSLYYHFNVDTQKLSPTGYKAVNNFVRGIAHVVPVDMVVDSTQVNRAQLFAPNTKKETIDALNFEKHLDAFGYLLNTNDTLLMDYPVSTLYKDDVLKEIEQRGGRVLSKTEKKNILLKVTRGNRSYDLKTTISEDEWNY